MASEPTVTIRRGRREDAEGLAALHREAGWCYDEAAVVAEYYDDAFEPETVLGAEVGGELVGKLELFLGWKSSSGRFGLIRRFVVHPAWRGRGIGHRLLAAAEEEARRAGCAFLEPERRRGQRRRPPALHRPRLRRGPPRDHPAPVARRPAAPLAREGARPRLSGGQAGAACRVIPAGSLARESARSRTGRGARAAAAGPGTGSAGSSRSRHAHPRAAPDRPGTRAPAVPRSHPPLPLSPHPPSTSGRRHHPPSSPQDGCRRTDGPHGGAPAGTPCGGAGSVPVPPRRRLSTFAFDPASPSRRRRSARPGCAAGRSAPGRRSGR